jgi:hypothetical protein
MSQAPGGGAPIPRILEEGSTCWRIALAERAAVLIDAADYYQALLEAFRRARSSMMILGWDFDPGIRLDPDDPHTELCRLLPALVERCPDLHVRLLIWDISVLYGPSSTVNQLFDRAWHAHPGIALRSISAIRSAPPITRSSSASTMRSRLPAASTLR